MPHTPRKGEPPSIRRRRLSRCFEINGRWYASTREGVYMGPFSTRDAAIKAAEELIDVVGDVDDPEVAQAFVRELSRRAVRVELGDGE
jgi:hypothetical protein